MAESRLYGLLAEFDSPAQLTMAIRLARREGFRDLEAFAPVPVEVAVDELGRRRTWVPALTLVGGLVGAVVGYAIQYYPTVIDYPLNIGGRPLHSWPAFAVVTIEVAILVAALAAVFGMLALSGLPRPHHPVFNVPEFGLASQTRFFLCVPASDPRFDPEKTRQFLARLGSSGVWEVPL